MAGSTQRRFDWVTFTSDYGHEDVFVGVCKGVIAQRAPHVRVLDVCHLVPQQDVERGATVLAAAMPYLPVAVHLALVDPMDGAGSRGVVVETGDGSLLVGPDNGLLSLAWPERGEVKRAFEATNSALWCDAVHRTFRGRDVFAPLAGHLAMGTMPEEVGPQIDPSGLTRISLREVILDDDHVHAEVRGVDHFGNVSLNATRSDLEAAGIGFGDTVELRCNGRSLSVLFTPTYGDVARGRLALCEDSFRSIMLSVNGGHASRRLEVSRGEPVVVARMHHQSPSPPAAV